MLESGDDQGTQQRRRSGHTKPKMIRSTTAILSLLAAAAPNASAQTTVGCDASCPPAGYESDSSHLCPGSSVSSFQSTREHVICHPTPGTSFSFDSFRLPGHVTVLANYYTGCEAGRRESGVFAGVAQRIHDETGGRVNFVTSLKGEMTQFAGRQDRPKPNLTNNCPTLTDLITSRRSLILQVEGLVRFGLGCTSRMHSVWDSTAASSRPVSP